MKLCGSVHWATALGIDATLSACVEQKNNKLTVNYGKICKESTISSEFVLLSPVFATRHI